MAALVLLGLTGCAVALALSFGPDPIAAATSQARPQAALLAQAPAQNKPATRRVYPYSVVPGGVASQAELVRIVRSDKVVATHYASFNLSRAHAVTVAKPRAVHVSYRKGDKVYWTAKKVTLREGEVLLSDGKNEMRTRCANRVSDVAQFPVEAHEPSAALLDTADDIEDGSLQNASADRIEEDEPTVAGQQFQLPDWSTAGAGQAASSSPDRTASVAFGAIPTPANRLGNGPPMLLASAATPGSAQPAQPFQPVQETVSDGAVATAPALVVATDVTQSNTPATSAPPASVAIRPELDPMPQPGSSAPTLPQTTSEAQPKPNEVPEPGTAWLIALALGSILVMRSRR